APDHYSARRRDRSSTGHVAGTSAGWVREGGRTLTRQGDDRDRPPDSPFGEAGRSQGRARQDGAVAPWAAASGLLRRVVGAYAFVVGCRGWPGRATYGGRRPCTSLRR